MADKQTPELFIGESPRDEFMIEKPEVMIQAKIIEAEAKARAEIIRAKGERDRNRDKGEKVLSVAKMNKASARKTKADTKIRKLDIIDKKARVKRTATLWKVEAAEAKRKDATKAIRDNLEKARAEQEYNLAVSKLNVEEQKEKLCILMESQDFKNQVKITAVTKELTTQLEIVQATQAAFEAQDKHLVDHKKAELQLEFDNKIAELQKNIKLAQRSCDKKINSATQALKYDLKGIQRKIEDLSDTAGCEIEEIMANEDQTVKFMKNRITKIEDQFQKSKKELENNCKDMKKLHRQKVTDFEDEAKFAIKKLTQLITDLTEDHADNLAEVDRQMRQMTLNRNARLNADLESDISDSSTMMDAILIASLMKKTSAEKE